MVRVIGIRVRVRYGIRTYIIELYITPVYVYMYICTKTFDLGHKDGIFVHFLKKENAALDYSCEASILCEGGLDSLSMDCAGSLSFSSPKLSDSTQTNMCTCMKW